MTYLLDTNVLLFQLRAAYSKGELPAAMATILAEEQTVLSVVSIGEIRSLALNNGWGRRRMRLLVDALETHLTIGINTESIIKRYAEIDAYSQGNLTDRPLATSARNMGKNDLWIAATASVYEARLLTLDKDFAHLNGVYLEVVSMII